MKNIYKATQDNSRRDWYIRRIAGLLTKTSLQNVTVTYRFVTSLVDKRDSKHEG